MLVLAGLRTAEGQVRVSLVLLLGWFACSAPPEVISVAPNEVAPGDSFVITGVRFGVEPVIALVADGVAIPALSPKRVSDEQLSASVPATFAPGPYDVRVSLGDFVAHLPIALTVTDPYMPVPCSGDSTANTEVSLPRGVVVVDRFWVNGHRDTRRVPLADVQALVLTTSIAGEQGAEPCSAVWLELDAARVLYQDERSVDLQPRAQRMAEALGKELRVE